MCTSRRHEHRHWSPGAGRTPDLRASDADRERTVSLLREHAAQGRLTIEELEDRIERAHAARTHGDLRALRADLPRIHLPEERRRRHDGAVRHYLAVMGLLVAIWALTGAGYFWPIWPMVGWGLAVLPHARLKPALRRRALSS